MINALIDMMCFLIGAIFTMIFSFIFLCMNVFTIPIILVLYIVCKVFYWKTPRPRFYSLMLYPSWSEKPKYSFINTVIKYNKRGADKANAKRRRQFEITRPWEARFFD